MIFERYGQQEGVLKGYNRANTGVRAITATGRVE